MPVDRPLSTLNIYDIQGNLIPGIVLLVLLYILLPEGCLPVTGESNQGLLLIGILVLGYTAGHVLQIIGGKMDRHILHQHPVGMFSRLMEHLEPNYIWTKANLPDTSHSQQKFRSGGIEIEITEIDREFWKYCREIFEVSEDYMKNPDLVQLLLSYIENNRTGRVLRFQALYSFYRSIFVVSIIAFVSLVSISFLKYQAIAICGSLENQGTIELAYYILGILLLVSGYIFYDGKNTFAKLYIRYLILEFYHGEVQHSHLERDT